MGEGKAVNSCRPGMKRVAAFVEAARRDATTLGALSLCNPFAQLQVCNPSSL